MHYSKVLSSSSGKKKTAPKNKKSEEPNILKSLQASRQQDSRTNKPRTVKPPSCYRNERPNSSVEKSNDPKSSFIPTCKFLPTLSEETKKQKIERLKKKLFCYESPFLWKPKDIKPLTEPRVVYERILQKDREINYGKRFKWRSFILQLVMIYELCNMKELSKALEQAKLLEDELEIPQNGRDWLFMGIEQALWHVVHASKLFIFIEMDAIPLAEQLLPIITPVESLSRSSSKAGLLGIRAAVLMEYGHRGNVKALEDIMKAVELDRTVAEWHFLLGKSMRRIRRVTKYHDLVDPAEEQAFSQALELDKGNPVYIIYVAQMLREKSFRIYKNGTVIRRSEEDQRMRRAAVASFHKYKQAIKINPNCPHLLTRCGFGIMKLPPEMVDLKFVNECIDKALELAPSNMMTHHVKGLLYERFYGEINKALEEMEKAYSLGNFAAGMDIVRVLARLNKPGAIIIETLEELAEQFEEPSKRQVAYAQAGSYCLFFEKDIVKAVEYYLKVIDIDEDSYALKSHKPMFFPLKYPINIFYLVLVELKSNLEWQKLSNEQNKTLRKFLCKTKHHEEKRLETIAKMKENPKNDETNTIETENCHSKKLKNSRIKKSKKKKKIKKKPKKALPDEELTVDEVLRISRCRVESIYKTDKRIVKRRTNWLTKSLAKKKAKLDNDAKQTKELKTETNKLGANINLTKNVSKTNQQQQRFPQGSSVSSQQLQQQRFPQGSSVSSQQLQQQRFPQGSSVSSVDSDYEIDHTLGKDNPFQSHNAEMLDFNNASCYLGPQENKSHYGFNQPKFSELTKSNLEVLDKLNMGLSSMSISSIGSTNSSDQENHKYQVTRQRSLVSTSSVESLNKSLNNLDLQEYNEGSNIMSSHSGRVHIGNLTRQLSLMSISTKDSSNSNDSLSVMERVKQSYRNLSYKSNNSQSQDGQKRLYKSESSQSLDKKNKKSNKKDKCTELQDTTFKGSTQSLNLPGCRAKPVDIYKPSSLLRDSSVESTRSLTFMPNFAKK